MDKEKALQLVGQLKDVVDWRDSGAEVDMPVSITTDDYYFDLGAFGEHSTYVELQDDYYPIDVRSIMDHAPHDLDLILQDLREVIDANEEVSSLDFVLGKMLASSDEDEQKLARVLIAVADAVRGFPTTAPSAAALPDSPLPWPGALREDIDYTADDFPLRYQPPPGFAWRKLGMTSIASHTECEKRPSVDLRKYALANTGDMVLDYKGRVSWITRDGDDFMDDKGRWPVWFSERDGIPQGTGNFNEETYPLPVDQSGYAMGEWKDSHGHYGVWVNDSDAETGLRRVQEIRDSFDGEKKKKETFEPPAPVSV